MIRIESYVRENTALIVNGQIMRWQCDKQLLQRGLWYLKSQPLCRIDMNHEEHSENATESWWKLWVIVPYHTELSSSCDPANCQSADWLLSSGSQTLVQNSSMATILTQHKHSLLEASPAGTAYSLPCPILNFSECMPHSPQCNFTQVKIFWCIFLWMFHFSMPVSA